MRELLFGSVFLVCLHVECHDCSLALVVLDH